MLFPNALAEEVMLFMGGIQLVALGIIGEYLGRMFNESKNRPLYFLKGYDPSDAGKKEKRGGGSKGSLIMEKKAAGDR